jgi:hypothetical protein
MKHSLFDAAAKNYAVAIAAAPHRVISTERIIAAVIGPSD